MWLVIRNEDGRLLSDPNTNATGKSWTTVVGEARTFPDEQAAQQECCENERPVPADSLFRQPR